MRRALCLLAVGFAGCGAPTSADVEREVFAKSCAFTSCHRGSSGAGGLSLDSDVVAHLVNVPSTGQPKSLLVVPGAPDSSWLYLKLKGPPAVGAQMPPGDSITQAQLDLVKEWIAAGAK